MLFQDVESQEKYPILHQYTSFVKQAEREIVGRKSEMRSLLAGMCRPELCNALLLGEAGAGKTALVQGVMMKDKDRLYLEVNLSLMISNNGTEALPGMLESLFAEVQAYRLDKEQEIVLFIDEFHRIVQESAPAVEALKPLLADSGTRGIKIIAATTYTEFRQFIAPNQPLVERLQRINITQPDKETTINILKGMAKRYGVDNQFYNDFIYEQIYEYTERYIPANSQPRKSILVLDNMVGWHRAEGRPLDKRLLADVIYEQEGINVSFRVDATKIKQALDKRVLAQGFATAAVEQRLQICVADLHNKTKPMSSLLFAGATGVGKGITNETFIPIWTEDGSCYQKRNGDLQIGDYVFNRLGKPVKVTGVYPRGLQDIYKVTLSDGRYLFTDSSHLWTYMLNKGKSSENTYTNSTKELYERGVTTSNGKNRNGPSYKYWIPVNHAVEYPEVSVDVHPYVMGAFIGNGSMTVNQLTFSSNDEVVVARLANLMGGCTYRNNRRNFNWVFPLNNPTGRVKSKQLYDVFGAYPEVCGKLSEQKRIPEIYMHGSVEQRWDLVQGLFDTDGSIGSKDGGRYNVSYSSTSLGLIKDIQQLLYSLGVSSTWTISRKETKEHIAQYSLFVKSSNANKDRFFWLPRKREIAESAKLQVERLSRKKDFDWLAITSIEKLDEQKETTCIMVDDEEHLYQAGQFVVTHNTELTKGLAELLFNDPFRLIRFDCTEYANASSLERFRRELTAKVWAMPYCIILLDEIEKACAEVTRVLLQVLDDGRLMDENNREVVFTNSYIILTTNAGSEVYENISQYNASDTGVGDWVKRYDKLIRDSISRTTGDNRFPPELLGRIDTIVPFQPLSSQTMKEITKMKLMKLKADVRKKHNIDLKINKDVIRYLVDDNLDTRSNSGGARVVVSKLESEVIAPVAKFINQHPGVASVGILVEGTLAADDKHLLESKASIKVVPV